MKLKWYKNFWCVFYVGLLNYVVLFMFDRYKYCVNILWLNWLIKLSLGGLILVINIYSNVIGKSVCVCKLVLVDYVICVVVIR